MKKKIAAITALIMVMGTAAALPENMAGKTFGIIASADVYGDWEYETTDKNTIKITAYNGTGSEIKIPSKIGGKTVTSIGFGVFWENETLTKITIPDGVTELEDDCFRFCTALTDVTIPDSVLSIGKYAFDGCTKLCNVKISNGVKTIGEYAFSDCSELTGITIPDSVISMEHSVFDNCTKLETVSLSKKLKEISMHTFNKCSALKNVTIPDNVNKIDNYAFNGCTGLDTIDIPDSVVTIGENAFNGCTSLEKISVGSGLQTIGRLAFYECENLGSIALPNGFVEIKEQAFANCSELKKAVLPDTIETIGDSAFEACGSLTDIEFPDSLKSIGLYAFQECSGLKEITIPGSVTTVSGAAFNNCSSLKKVEIKDGVRTIGKNAFSYCTSLQELTLPDSVTKIERAAFLECPLITKYTIPETVKEIGNLAFGYGVVDGNTKKREDFELTCYKGTVGEKYAIENNFEYTASFRDIEKAEVTVSPSSVNYDGTEKCPAVIVKKGEETLIKDVDYDLEYADNIEIGTATATITGKGDFSGTIVMNYEIKDPNSVKDNKCGENTTWALSEDGTLTVSGTGKMYNFEPSGAPWSEDASKIKKLVVEDGAESIGDNAFSGLENLVSVDLPDTVTYIGDSAFCYDNALSEINNISSNIKSIGAYAFEGTAWLDAKRKEDPLVIIEDVLIDGVGCSGDIVVPEGVVIISGYAFYGNTAITSVRLPDGVREIRDQVFSGCTALSKIEIPLSTNIIHENAFNGCANDLTIFGYEPSVAKNFADKMKLIFKRLLVDISSCEITLDKESYVFEGKPVEAVISVRLNGTNLTRGIDYTVEYADNDKVGTATVTVTGKDKYSGTASKTFEINAKAEDDRSRGDINGDGIINVSDISKAAAHVKGKRALEESEEKAADVNGDGEINVSDISLIAAHVKGIRSLT